VRSILAVDLNDFLQHTTCLCTLERCRHTHVHGRMRMCARADAHSPLPRFRRERERETERETERDRETERVRSILAVDLNGYLQHTTFLCSLELQRGGGGGGAWDARAPRAARLLNSALPPAAVRATARI
jgi:hypothetical protein